MPGGSEFKTTSWSLILSAVSDPTTDARQALASLCQTYWNPVYSFIRRNGHDPDQAQDLAQEFFARLIEKNYLGDVDRRRGRFRSFLLTSVKHFLANEWDRNRALKRGGGYNLISIDIVEAERWYVPSVVEGVTPESLFERRWVLSLLQRVLEKLRVEYVSAGKEGQFAALEGFLNHGSDDRYQEAAGKMGVSVGALRMSVHRMRRKYRELLRAEIAETVLAPEDIDDEIRFLLSTLNAG
jgi:RNA polymerase sigma factor (sigma-70 family)